MDWVGGLEEALAHIDEFKLVQKAQKGISGRSSYAQLKQEMWRETIRHLEQWNEDEFQWQQKELQWGREKARRESKVQEWEKQKAKL